MSQDRKSAIINDHELYKELLKLNFFNQYCQFEDVVSRNLVSLILINGKKENGIEMLRAKLVNPILTASENQKEISINSLPPIKLNGSEGIIYPSQVWQKLATYIEVSGNKTLSENEIALRISKACPERPIIIAFEIDREIPVQFLEDIINHVCKPLLANRSSISSENQSNKNKFLIFFIDYTQKSSTVKGEQICKLTTTSFTEEDIKSWMANAEQQFTKNRLPTAFSLSEAKKIYSDSQSGNPRLVYKNIYQLFDITWHNSEVHRRVG